jgi:hypothetical protein
LDVDLNAVEASLNIIFRGSAIFPKLKRNGILSPRILKVAQPDLQIVFVGIGEDIFPYPKSSTLGGTNLIEHCQCWSIHLGQPLRQHRF